jgi:hypothetical protein
VIGTFSPTGLGVSGQPGVVGATSCYKHTSCSGAGNPLGDSE